MPTGTSIILGPQQLISNPEPLLVARRRSLSTMGLAGSAASDRFGDVSAARKLQRWILQITRNQAIWRGISSRACRYLARLARIPHHRRVEALAWIRQPTMRYHNNNPNMPVVDTLRRGRLINQDECGTQVFF